ncbi:MAG: hypothetical protein A2X58_03690 [Nitrospirae bacterium GWC2_56_14]|nr:MAG: hypothetical protein A2X58_03690 [Nitrospirae bacterium GWC2_56_14]
MNIDQNRLNILAAQPVRLPTARELRREGRVFFVGGALPVNETLETMFASFCTESTDLFYLSFGEPATVAGGLELARQIRKNFNVRLMARFDYPVPVHIAEHAYAAGVDIMDITSSASHAFPGGVAESLRAARSVFPRWSVASTLPLGAEPLDATIDLIDALLADGVVPLAILSGERSGKTEEISAELRHLTAGWKANHVTIKPLVPLIAVMTPLVPTEQTGLLRGFIDRLEERRLLAAADLRRHLRVNMNQDSLDSAAL